MIKTPSLPTFIFSILVAVLAPQFLSPPTLAESNFRGFSRARPDGTSVSTVRSPQHQKSTQQKVSAPTDRIFAQRRLSPQMDFFDMGQQQMEQEIIRMQQQAPKQSSNPVITGTFDSGFWQPIISKAGNFSIWMAPGTLSEETKELATGVGKLQFRVLASNSGDDRFVVTYTDLPQSVIAQSSDNVLTAVRERLKSRTSYALVNEQTISLSTQPGRSLTFQGSGEVITVRYYLATQRLYLIAAKHKGNALNQTATTFLNSFQLLNQ